MAFHYYTGSDILANRGSPHFGAESPDGRLGLLMAIAKMAMAGDRQWQEQEASRGRGWHGMAGYNIISGICKENPKNPDGIDKF